MTRKRIVAGLLTFVVLTTAALVTYRILRERASDKIKNDILRVADDMTLSPVDRAEAKRLIAAAHEGAFDDALHLTGPKGSKFDGERYINGLFERVVAQARSEGRGDLADTIERERANFSFDITER